MSPKANANSVHRIPNNCNGNTLAVSSGLPRLRVFNRDFVAKQTFLQPEVSLTPIYFLGEDSVEKQNRSRP